MINIYKTLLFNIKAFGWRVGLQLPVFVYGDLKIHSIGKIKLNCPVRRRLITIGVNRKETTVSHTSFNNRGVIEVGGKLFINFGCKLTNHGHISFAGNDVLSQCTSLDIRDSLRVGRSVAVGYCSSICDTDAHYLVDVATRSVRRNTKSITIGNYNFICSHTHIKKGTVTPDYITVASPNAMLDKDFSHVKPHSVLAGCPAKVIAGGIRRVFNTKHEHEIRTFFAEHPDADTYDIEDNVNLDDYCAFNF